MTEDFNAGRLYLDAYIDTAGATKGLQRRLDAEIRAKNIRAKIKAELDTRGFAASAKKAATEASKSVKVKLQTELDTRGLIASAKAAALAASAASRVKIKAEIDEASALKAQAQIAAMSRGEKVDVNVDADTGKAEATVEGFRASQERRGLNIGVNINTSQLSQAGTALATLGKIPMLVGGFYTLGAAIVGVGSGLFSMAAAAAQAAGTLAVLPNLIGAAGQGIAALVIGLHGIGGALQAYTKVQKQAGATAARATKVQTGQANAIRSASQQIVQAEHAQTQAHEQVKTAQENLTKARIEAKKHIDDLKRSLIEATHAETAAAGDLQTAQENMQDVNWDLTSSPQEKRKAAQDLQEAKDNLVDATAKKKDLAQQSAAADKAGVEGSDQVIQAKKAIRDATWAAQAADIALANAQRGLAQAHKQTAVAANGTTLATSALAYAMAQLSPAGQKFVQFLHSTLLPRFKDLRFAVQEALLPPLQVGIEKSMPLLNTLQRGLVGSARVIGSFAVKLGTLFGRKTFNKDVAQIMGTNNRALGIFGQTALNLIKILTKVAVVAGPHLLIPFAKWTRQLTAGWLASLNTQKGMKGLGDFFDRARARAGQLTRILGNLIAVIGGIGRAAIAGSGNDLMKSFEDTTARWSKAVNSKAGQKSIENFFKAVKPVTSEFGTLLATIGKFFTLAAKSDASPIVGFMRTINALVAGINKGLANPVLGPVISKLLTLAGVAGAFALIAGGLLKMGGGLAKIGKVTGFSKLISGITGSKKAIDDELPADKKKGKAMDSVGTKAARAAKSLGGKFVAGAKAAGRWAADGAQKVGRFALEMGKVGAGKAKSGLVTAGKGFASVARTAGLAALNAGKFVVQMVRVGIQTAIATGKMLVQKGVQLAVAAATKAWAVAQWILDAAMSANPVGAVIAALVLLGVALVLLWKRSSTFRTIVLGVWHAVQKAVSIAWNYYYKPILRSIWTALRTLGSWFTWLWRNAVKPAWDVIKKAVSLAWTYYYKPILKSIWTALRTLGSVFTWLWRNAVKPAWSAIRDAIRTVWNNVLHPILSRFVTLIRTTLPNAFSAAVTAIKTAWDKLKDAARKPVAFVVNTVYNKGIVPMVNAIPGVPGTLHPVKGFARGGIWEGAKRTGRRVLHAATGAILPGYSPGVDDHQFYSPTGGRLDLSGGEAIMVPQWARALGPAAVKLLNAAARRGKAALARALAYVSGKAGDLGVGRGRIPAFKAGGVLTAEQISRGQMWAKGQVGKPYKMGGVGPFNYDCSGFIGDIENVLRGATGGAIFSRDGTTATFPWSGWKPGVGQFTVGSTKNYGGSGVGHMAGMLSGLRVESYGGHGPSVTHRSYDDPGFDTVAHLGAGGTAAAKHGLFFNALKAIKGIITKVPDWLQSVSHMGGWGPMMRQMLHSAGAGLVHWVDDKIPGPGPVPTHLFDKGGALYPGSTYATNNTGKVETVFTNEQMVTMQQRLAETARVMLSTITDAKDRDEITSLIHHLEVNTTPDQLPQALQTVEYKLRQIRMGGPHAVRSS